MFGGQTFIRVSRDEFLKVKADAEYWRGVAESYRIKAESTPQPTKLYTVTTWVSDSDGARLNVREFGNAVEVKAWESLFGRGLRVIGEGGTVIVEMHGTYSYSLTEQKPEAEKASFDCGGVSWLSQIDRHIDRLLDQPVNVRSLTLAREEMERKIAKNHDALNHRIEMLELRLGNQSFGKQTDAEPKPMSAAYKRIVRNAKAKKAKPQPKGAKR